MFHLHQIKRKLCLLHKETAKLCQLFRIFHLKRHFKIISAANCDISRFNPFFSHFCQKAQASPLVRIGILQASCLVEQRLDYRVILEKEHVYY